MSRGLWGNNGSGTAPTKGKLATAVTCCVCGGPLRRFTTSSHPMCRTCGANVVRARFELEREGVLPRHGRAVDGVYTDPLVIERARQMRTTTAAPPAGPSDRFARHEEAPTRV